MRPLGVVEVDPLADHPFGLEAVGQLKQVDGLVFERAPQAFDKDVVHAPAPPIHGDRDFSSLENAGEVEAGELAALIGIEDFRFAVFGQRLVQGLDAEGGIHGVRQPPGEDMARRPVHDRDEVQEAAQHLRDATTLAIDFEGFCEADKINRGDVDVVVTDGFSGNIALKAIEGSARFVTDLLKTAFRSSLRSKIGFLVSRPATELLRHHLDPNNHNGAVFLGLNGVVVKSHGSANAKGVANAVEVAARLLEDDITNRIKHDLAAVGTEGLAAK